MPSSMSKVTFTKALTAMASAAWSAKANEWGVEPHWDFMTDQYYIVYVFDSNREATSMARQLTQAKLKPKIIYVPATWKEKANEGQKVPTFTKGRYYGVYGQGLQVDEADLKCTPHLTKPSYLVPHV